MDELDTGKLRAVIAKYIPIRETYLTAETVSMANAAAYRLVSAEFDHAAVNALPTLLDTIDTQAVEIARLREGVRNILLECHETIPPDGNEAAWAALDSIAKNARTLLENTNG